MGAVRKSKVNIKPTIFGRGYGVYPGRQEAEAFVALDGRSVSTCMPKMHIPVPLVQSASLDHSLWSTSVSGKEFEVPFAAFDMQRA